MHLFLNYNTLIKILRKLHLFSPNYTFTCRNWHFCAYVTVELHVILEFSTSNLREFLRTKQFTGIYLKYS